MRAEVEPAFPACYSGGLWPPYQIAGRKGRECERSRRTLFLLSFWAERRISGYIDPPVPKK